MEQKTPKPGPAGTTDQSPRWEGPEETRPRGYLPAIDNPETEHPACQDRNHSPLSSNSYVFL